MYFYIVNRNKNLNISPTFVGGFPFYAKIQNYIVMMVQHDNSDIRVSVNIGKAL